MDWFSGPLTEIFGVPTFWVARAAKIAQFLSGMVILIDIIGKERIETFANAAKRVLSKMAAAEPIKEKDLY
jgi:hypothetical protein